MIYHEKSESWHWEFLIIQKTIDQENHLCQNYIRTVLKEGI